MKNTKWLGRLSIIALILTATWLVLLIVDIATIDPNETFEQMVSRLSRLDLKFYLIYLTVGLLTLVVPFQMAALYQFCKPDLPDWLAISGLVFVPVYCGLNLFAYLSQISAIPFLLGLYQSAQNQQIAETLLKLLLQGYAGSMVEFFNNLAYALLGIPSIIYGFALTRQNNTFKAAGLILAANGIACILGIIGIAVQNPLLSWGSAIGGGLYFLALFPLSWGSLKF